MSGMFDLTGKVALVTGGGSGIGRSMCEGLAENGADVAVADLDEASAKETVDLLAKYGHRTMAIKFDVSNWGTVESMVQQVVAKFGKLDIACNNAGAYSADTGSTKPRKNCGTSSWRSISKAAFSV